MSENNNYANPPFTNLKKIKASKKPPKEGDVFVIQPFKGVYLFGKVLMTNIESTNDCINGMYLIIVYDKIFQANITPTTIPGELGEPLFAPDVVNKRGWTMGYYYTIGNQPVTQAEKDLDYGFQDMIEWLIKVPKRERYVDIHGNELGRRPTWCSMWALGSYGAIGELTQKALKERNITDPNPPGEADDEFDPLAEEIKKYSETIAPFFWREDESGASVCLNTGEYLKDIFALRKEEGFIGNGYDWESLAKVFLSEKYPDIRRKIKFDSEAGMFCAYAKNKEVLKQFAEGFKELCENRSLILDMFFKAKLIT